MTAPTRRLGVERLRDGAWSSAPDAVAVEEPLEIRVAGDTVAVTMRTPGSDRELALGFLFAEGIVRSVDDVSAVAHCGRGDDDAGRGNTIEVTPAPGVRIDLGDDTPFARRGTISSACGVCGRRSIDDLLARCAPVQGGARIELAALLRAVEGLRSMQPRFAETGGCHGAGLFTLDGEAFEAFEDVGRHNAVDKLIGSQLLRRALPLRDRVLVVSGRTSFEIVQKAAVAGVPVVVGVSAASSLAVDVAERAGITLVGFARGGSLVVYAGRERIT
jgi:FdhD protein